MFVLIFSFLFLTAFILCAPSAIPETAEALKTFLFIVLPSVFPLCVLSDWLVRSGAFRIPSRFLGPLMNPLFGVSEMGGLSVITSLIGSYPTAAKTTAQLYKNGEITKEDALRLSAFTNNAGPLFIIGVLGTNILKDTFLGVIMWLCHITASILSGLIMGKCSHKKQTVSPKSTYSTSLQRPKALLQLSSSIASAMETMVPVCGTVLFFASICAILESPIFASIQPLSSVGGMLLEMTTGCQTAAKLTLNIIPRCCLLAGIASWGGCSVHMQIIYLLSQNGLSCTRYILGKVLHTILSVLLTAIVCMIYV
ncbi:MAG: hypothetical protein IKU26_06365 [Clostridia bacterium]|nr:hypothetical protein [Clostridia bacterium]